MVGLDLDWGVALNGRRFGRSPIFDGELGRFGYSTTRMSLSHNAPIFSQTTAKSSPDIVQISPRVATPSICTARRRCSREQPFARSSSRRTSSRGTCRGDQKRSLVMANGENGVLYSLIGGLAIPSAATPRARISCSPERGGGGCVDFEESDWIGRGCFGYDIRTELQEVDHAMRSRNET